MVDPAAAAAKPAVPPNARIKGSSLRPFFGWCSATLGAERVKRALAQVPGE